MRSQPRDLPGPEVIKRAAAAGLKISSALIYQVRNHAWEGAPHEATADTALSVASDPAGPAASDLLRASLPRVPDVIAAAAAQGIAAGPSTVYQVRNSTAQNTGMPPAPTFVAAPVTPEAGPPATATRSSESMFRRLVLELGLTRSKALLAEVERKLESLIAGS